MKTKKKVYIILILVILSVLAVAVFINASLLLESIILIVGGLAASGLFFLAAYDLDLHRTIVWIGFVPLPGVIFCLLP